MSEKILLVEDSRTQAEALRALLSDAGYEVSLAYSTEAALEEVGRGATFDLGLSDIVMPGGKSGVDLARELRELRPDLPVVLATGYADLPSPPVGTRVVQKPYRVDEITATLIAALRG